jgi:hypothetical protein
VKSLIFSLLIFASFLAFGQDIKAVYEANKNKVKVEQAVEVEGYVFSSSISKAESGVDVLIDKNKMIATSRLLDFPIGSIDWPKHIAEDLKYMLWRHYLKTLNKSTISGVTLLDNGQIGKNYYVVVGVEASKVHVGRVTYENILESLR